MNARPSCRSMLCHVLLTLLALATLAPASLADKPAADGGGKQPLNREQAAARNVSQGSLRIVKDDGSVVECPLKHTDVKADVSGFVARVRVTQTFYNPTDERIEAVYVFPLPHKSAVDEMTMVVGERRIVGVIKRREEARAIYEQALAQGQLASLLEQERPNIFTQSVGNIEPKQEVKIEIGYVDVLEYDMGTYTFHFPMVVGPRFIPGSPVGPAPGGNGQTAPTNRVPDAHRINPPILKPGQRNGHDISLALTLDAGVPVHELVSPNHKATIDQTGQSTAKVELSPADNIPNKDFVLKYKVIGQKPEVAVLTHTGDDGEGYFMLTIQPREDERLKQSPPREIFFLIDTSGSMSGQPTAKVKETMANMLKLCKTDDTVQVLTFAGASYKLFKESVPVTKDNIEKALNFSKQYAAGGGTNMLEGIRLALQQPADPKRVRIVVMLTDGYIGNEAEIFKEVGTRTGDQVRFWCIGVGSSVNRHLVDGVGRQGQGKGVVLGLDEDAKKLATSVMNRIHRAQLAHINIDYGDLWTWETYPAQIPELWAGMPVVVYGRYQGGLDTTVTVRGKVEGEPASWPVKVKFPMRNRDNAVLAKVWARQKIEDLMQQVYYMDSPEVQEAVTGIALEYSLMSQYTSFVAVDEESATEPSDRVTPPRRMMVAVPIPAGTQYEGFFGPAGEMRDVRLGGSLTFKARKNTELEELQRLVPADPAAGAFRLRRRTEGLGGWKAGGFDVPGRRKLSLRLARPANGRKQRAAQKRYAPRPAMDAAAPHEMPAMVLAENGKKDIDRSIATGAHYTGWAFQGIRTDEYLKTLAGTFETTLEEAEADRKAGRLLAARNRYAWLVMLNAAIAVGDGDKAMDGLDDTNEALREAAAKTLPGLDRKLDRVIRSRSLEQAVREVSDAAGLTLEIEKGSLDDVRALMHRRFLKVPYLDLRGATAAQALDWLLTPERLTWHADGEAIVVASMRRTGPASPWVYDITPLVMPLTAEYEELDHQKRVALTRAAFKAFRDAVTDRLKLDETRATWYGPGQLLIMADADTHKAAHELFATLADPKATFEDDALKTLHAETSKRAAEREDYHLNMAVRNDRMGLVALMDSWSWRLLAEAAEGRIDDEALSHLYTGWNHPHMAEVLKRSAGPLVFRSAWAITEADRSLTRNIKKPDGLRALAMNVRFVLKPATGALIEKFAGGEGAKPITSADRLALLYAGLIDREKTGPKALELLTKDKAKQTDPIATLGASLLKPAAEIPRDELTKLIEAGRSRIVGDDLVALTALAARRAGGDTWHAFRAQSKDLLGRQPLTGGVVVMVNRLSKSPLAGTATLDATGTATLGNR